MREDVKQVNPHALGGPSYIPVVERFSGPIIGRGVYPAASRFQHMNDAADHTSIRDTRLATRVCRQMWLDLGKLRVRQPEKIPIHPTSPLGRVNHKPLIMPNALWVWTLAATAHTQIQL